MWDHAIDCGLFSRAAARVPRVQEGGEVTLRNAEPDVLGALIIAQLREWDLNKAATHAHDRANGDDGGRSGRQTTHGGAHGAGTTQSTGAARRTVSGRTRARAAARVRATAARTAAGRTGRTRSATCTGRTARTSRSGRTSGAP